MNVMHLRRDRRAICLLTFGVALIGMQALSALADSSVQLPPVLLQMVRDEAIQTELKLSPTQKLRVREALESVDTQWWLSRHLQPAELALELEKLTSSLADQLNAILDPLQSKRLTELQRQAVGTRMVLRSDVAAELMITQDQHAKLTAAFTRTDQEAAAIQSQHTKGELDASQAQSKVEQLKRDERKKIVDVLSDQQKVNIAKLTGTPFDFSQVQRTFPLAPALQTDGASWIQGGPLTLDELKGKVVAVHFYAFQCINCQRNFPHYEAWYRDFADRGLVVIGIQTPETSAERDLARVRAAVVSDGFKFPVVMDSASSNWKIWGNTMWPSVYLIDKQGFIRRWWQGEMNWQGVEGEKQMRETIESLLREES